MMLKWFVMPPAIIWHQGLKVKGFLISFVKELNN